MKIDFIEKWDDDLIWCPSQCYRSFKLDNKVLTLYCRWRGSDPWTFSIIGRRDTWIDIGAGMSESDSIEDVHNFAEELLKKYIAERYIKGRI